MTQRNKEKILILVKTYPNISTKHREIVCTAGVRENGSWVRLYPIPFRYYDEFEKFEKYQWIDVALEKNREDHRKESHRIVSEIIRLNRIGTENSWQFRKEYITKQKIYTSLEEIIEANKNQELSLCTFKPTKILDVTEEFVGYHWSDEKQAVLNYHKQQSSLFEDATSIPISDLKKLPYIFRYKFEDDSGKTSSLYIEDWEFGALYWHYKDSATAVEKVKEKLWSLVNNDLHFF